MMIGGALGAVSGADPKPVMELNTGMMNPMIGGQAMLPDRDIMDNLSASPMHGQLTAALTIPNEEVRSIYEKQFAGLLVDSLGGDLERKSFLRALLAGDTARLEEHLSRWLLPAAGLLSLIHI